MQLHDVNPFPLVFYSAATLAAAAAVLSIFRRAQLSQSVAILVLVVPLVLSYLLGMYRIGGPDFANYAAYLGSQRDLIPDVGYRWLMGLVSTVQLTLPEFFLVQGIFTLVAIYVLAIRLRSDLVVTTTLYMLHAAIVRDFAHSRVALALAVYYLALAQKRKLLYCVLTVCAASIHLTVVSLVIVMHWAQFVAGLSKWRNFLTFGPAVALVVGISILLPVLMSLDPRVEIYVNWNEDSYGRPVESYGAIVLFALIAAICLRARAIADDRISEILFITVLYAAATFLAFRELSIFASRFSNVIAALYPFAIGRAVTLMRTAERGRPYNVAIVMTLVVALLVVLGFRSGSLDALRTTEPALLTGACGDAGGCL